MISRLICDLLQPTAPGKAFTLAVMQLDDTLVSASLPLREPISDLVVASPVLMQENFFRHSVSEQATVATLESVAAKLKPGRLRDQMIEHAADERRHTQMFRALADGLADETGKLSGADYQWILDGDCEFVEAYNGDVIEFICDLFAGEVRNYFFLRGYLVALARRRSSRNAKIEKVLRQVLEDESRHARYTALYVNEWMTGGLDLTGSLQRSFIEFDKVSWADVMSTAEFFKKR